PHGGSVIRTGATGLESENSCVIEYSLKLGSNPEFTASVLVAYARAVYKMYKNKNYGCKTVFDVPPIDLIDGEYLDVLAKLL
ncbi:MAG: diaminopimelate dehydrogenase, partial [Clostridia bacterium]|nr:diaminopimelate dehydrogenase [Clostridia bacterium]